MAFWDAARRCAAGDTALRVTVGATGWGSGSPHSAWPPFWLPRSDWCLLVPRGGGILGRCAAGWGALLGLGLAAFCLAGSLILLVLACAAGRWHFGTLRGSRERGRVWFQLCVWGGGVGGGRGGLAPCKCSIKRKKP